MDILTVQLFEAYLWKFPFILSPIISHGTELRSVMAYVSRRSIHVNKNTLPMVDAKPMNRGIYSFHSHEPETH
jgi:hypothetical protein